MLIIVAKNIFHKKFTGFAIFPFIFLREERLKQDKTTLNHEKIHLHQQAELLWIFFFVWYGLEFVIRLIQYQNSLQAYRNISFEREAYTREHDINYLQQRKHWAFRKYLRQIK